METNLKTASVLAFERKLDPSDALFYAGTWVTRDQNNEWAPITIREKSVRGTISHRISSKDQDPAKIDASIENPNLQTIDVATLTSEKDTLKVQFSLRILDGTGVPSACNNSDYQDKLVETVRTYVTNNGFSELAWRYAFNLANGRFLWRNRLGSERVEVQISRMVDGEKIENWTFDALSLSLRNFQAMPDNETPLGKLSALIEQGLAGKEHALLDITAFVRIGAGQEVFPSQELILDRGRSTKSRTLYEVNKIAAIHSQKIGNAIRSIDTWYPGAHGKYPIAVEPYGSVTTEGKAYRQPREKVDFYNLLDDWILKDKVPSLENQHYVVAVLVRGGVFGAKD